MIIRLYDQNSYLNIEDLNRIEENISACHKLVFAEDVSYATDKDFNSTLSYEYLNRIESSILDMWKLTQDAYEKPKTNWKVGDSISYVDLNRIEQNLKIIYETFSKGKAKVIYPGENKYLMQEFI